MHVSRVSQLPSYEDRYPGHTDTGYAVTNESLDAHAEVLKGTKVRRVAAITSGRRTHLPVLPPEGPRSRRRRSLVSVAECDLYEGPPAEQARAEGH
jgi:hypothetical protein